MTGALSRRKGLRYEREIAERLRALFPSARRNVTEAQQGGQGVDLVGTGRLAVQCKRGRKYAPVARIEEINGAGVPVLITRGDRTRDVACLYLDDLLAILGDVGIVYD